ncbi:unnamed protein product, partial [Symbiodinium necroappetens]
TVGLSGYDWLGEGYKLLSASALSWSRDFLCPAFSAEWDTPAKGFLDAEGLALQLRRLLKHLPTPVKQQGVWKVARELLFPGEMANFWTGHSARHVATSLAAALGVSKDRRDYLGRWAYAQHGSQDYVLTSRQVVQGVQNFICKCLIVGHPDGGYTEEELFCTMRSYAEALHLAGDEIVKACSVLQWDDVEATWKLGGNFPSFAVSPDRVRAAAGNMGADLPGPYQDFEQEEDRDDAPYFITISRKGFRRLHLSKKCAVRRENCLETLPIFKLSEGIADAVCKLCKPKVESAEGSSTSGSEDTQVENPVEPEGIVCMFALAAGGVQPESGELRPQCARASMATDLPAGVDQAAALNHLDKNVSSDLVHIFQECGVPLGLQYRLTLNFQSVKRFSTYADSRADVRTALKDDHTLEATDQATRAAVASVVSAWETAKEYASKESELRAEVACWASADQCYFEEACEDNGDTDYCCGKGGKMDQAPLRPPWVVVLNYEYELRKEAIKRAYRDSRPLRETLREVTEDAQIKEQYFTSPIALQNRGKRASDSWEPWDDGNYNKWNRNSWKGGWQHKGDNDKGRKGRKGKEDSKRGKDGKDGKGGKGQSITSSRTPDGRFICFAYSGPGCDGNCGMVHCCQVKGCFGPHPTWKHWQQQHENKSSEAKN